MPAATRRTSRLSVGAQRTIAAACVVALVLSALYFRQLAKLTRTSEPETLVVADQSLPPGPVLRLMAMGHNEALADLLWLNALSHFGLHAWRRNDPGWLDASINALESVDPRFQLVYEWAGTVLVYGSGFQQESILRANDVLRRGVRRFPMSWTLWRMLGTNYYFELPPTSNDPEQIAAWRAEGADYLARAAALPNAPESLRTAALSMYTRRGVWSGVVYRASDNYLHANERLDAITGRAYLAQVLSGPWQLVPMASRELRLRMGRDPMFRLRNELSGYVLHPDALYLTAPSLLLPPPFEHTR